jgi:hypothetical protein
MPSKTSKRALIPIETEKCHRPGDEPGHPKESSADVGCSLLWNRQEKARTKPARGIGDCGSAARTNDLATVDGSQPRPVIGGMKVLRLALAVSCVAILSGCSRDSPATPTPTRLSATITPNPLLAPATSGSRIFFNLALRAGTSGSVLILTADAKLLDASGTAVGETQEFWSQAAGCTQCSTDVRLAAGTPSTYSGKWITYIGGGRPVRFTYTLSFADDQGNGTTTVEVPVQ